MEVLKKGKVVDKLSWSDITMCATGCGAKLKYGFTDVRTEKAINDMRPGECRAAYNYITCPECGKRHRVTLPAFRKQSVL